MFSLISVIYSDHKDVIKYCKASLMAECSTEVTYSTLSSDSELNLLLK